jgi:hypothetical protein
VLHSEGYIHDCLEALIDKKNTFKLDALCLFMETNAEMLEYAMSAPSIKKLAEKIINLKVPVWKGLIKWKVTDSC